ncbi:fungal-specific transcription factor domain-containing protein [Mycotypha africana]|uniref:fungal-specific transcription factor domain-containing protein n=1 Tax=Mycotypha africana TaxID=64632 RepID=UPI002301C199|nr:fungal-specific transcription factor domain-containing protein [Mycotypha africana]KAI8969172.1 fungal-specific transcription factor domain-containing protein [Mycotypha africana]
MIPIAPAPIQSQESSSEQQPLSRSTEILRTKRRRAKRSCDLCRQKKTRCDSSVNYPCSNCKKNNSECRFLKEQKKRGPAPRSYVAVLEDRVQRMEKLLEKVSNNKQSSTPDDTIYQQQQQLLALPLTENKGSASDSSFLISASLSEPSPKDDISEDGYRQFDKYNNQASDVPYSTALDSDENDNSPDMSSPNLLEEPEEECEKNSTNTIDGAYANMEQQLKKLTINDYQRTRYIGSSSGVHLLDDQYLISNRKHRSQQDTSWFVQKLNKDKEEHIIMKTQEVGAIVSKGKLKDRSQISYLKDIPYITQEFLDCTVYMFFTYNQLYCPFINKVQFLEQYYFHNPSPPDKYLFYAILHVSVSAFRDSFERSNVVNLTPDQWTELQHAIKEKALNLLGIVHKRSMISTVQALMILGMFASYNCKDDEQTSHWFLTGMAIRTAQDLGLHRDCSKWCIPEYEKELRRRIWYAAYMMDRWVSAELGRPLSILDHEFDVQLPSPYELDYQPIADFPEDSTPSLILETQAALKERRPIYIAFTNLLTLTQIFGEVLHTFYLTDKAKEDRYNDVELLNLYDERLAQWKSALPVELQFDVNRLHESKQLNPAQISASIVNMIYGSILLLLFRPYIKRQNESSSLNPELAFRSLSICTAAAVNILSIAESVEVECLVVLPWKMSIYALFQAAVIFLHNTKGENDVIKEQGREYLTRCSKVYLGHPYLSQAMTLKVLQLLIENFDVSMKDIPISENTRTEKGELLSKLLPKGNHPSQQQKTCYIDSLVPHITTAPSKAQENTKLFHEKEALPQSNYTISNVDSSSMFAKSNGTSSTAVENTIGDMSGHIFPTTTNSGDGFMDFSLDQQTIKQNYITTTLYNNSNADYLIEKNIDNESHLWLNGQQYSNDNNDLPNSCTPKTAADYQRQPTPVSTFYPSTSTYTTTYNLNTPFTHTENSNIHQHPRNPFDLNYLTSSHQAQAQTQGQTIHFDSTCLTSEVPLWDLPSGGTWNDWEAFIRNNQSQEPPAPPG